MRFHAELTRENGLRSINNHFTQRKLLDQHTKPRSFGQMIKATDRCLIIEDNFVIFLDIEEMVTSAGFKSVDQATNSTQVRDCLKRHSYRIALLDLRLGCVHNNEIIHILNQHEIPFAITSTYSIEGETGAIFGVVPVIPKPYATKTVSRTIRQLLMFPTPK